MRLHCYSEMRPTRIRLLDRFDEKTKMVTSWAKDIQSQSPDLSWGQCIEIAERWIIEWQAKN